MIIQNKLNDVLYVFPLRSRPPSFKPNKSWDILGQHINKLTADVKSTYFFSKNIPALDLTEFKKTYEAISSLTDISNEARYGMFNTLFTNILDAYVKVDKGYVNLINKHFKSIDKFMNNNYDEVSKIKSIAREEEKQTFTDKLKNMSAIARQESMELKTHKLGMWSVGLNKSVFVYNKHEFEAQQILKSKEELAQEIDQFDPSSNDPEEEPEIALSIDEEGDEADRED